MNGIWINPDGLRVSGQGKPGGMWADGTCPDCNVAYHRERSCGCGKMGGTAWTSGSTAQLPVPPPPPDDRRYLAHVRHALKSGDQEPLIPPRPPWLRPLLRRLFRPVSCTAMWICQLATVFWLEVRTLPEKPFEGIVDLPEGVPYNYLTAGLICAIFGLWALCNFSKPKES